MKISFIVSATIGLFIGICLAYSIDFSTQVFLVSLVLGIINFLIYKFNKRSFGVYKSETPIFLSILFLFISFGILLGQNSLSKDISQEKKFNDFISQKDDFIGVIYDVKNTEKSQQLFIHLNETDFKIKIIAGRFPIYKIGQVLSIQGDIKDNSIVLPEVTNGLNKSFDVSIHDSLKDIDGEIAFPKMKVLGIEEGFIYKIKNLKNRFVEILDEVSPRSVAALSAGTTLGDESLFSKEDLDSFRTASLSHIIVLSGFNITILILFFSGLFLLLRVRLKWRIFFTILAIIIFIVFVGLSTSIIRAAIMGSILLLANISGRQYVAKQALFISAFIMMLISPKIAPYDISFHLSFLATAGILYLVSLFDKYKFFKKENYKNSFTKYILDFFKVTLAVQIFVLPYIMYTFGTVSVFGIIANILVVPFVGVVMLLALLIIISYFIFPLIAQMFSMISFICCKYIFSVANFFSSFSFSKINSTISISTLIILYLLLVFLIYFENKRFKIKKYE